VSSLLSPALSRAPHAAARRLYQDDSCGLARVVAAPGAPPLPAHDIDPDAWAAALVPGLPASQRSAVLADLFGLPADGANGKCRLSLCMQAPLLLRQAWKALEDMPCSLLVLHALLCSGGDWW